MTDREKLLSLIGEMQDHGLYYGEHGFGIQVENERLADHLIQSGVMGQRWIPVTERLPEEGRSVIVYNAPARCAAEAVYKGEGKFLQFRWSARLQVREVTHWMPLPDPPQVEREMEEESDG
jgi:hypothetical protein